MIQEHSHHVFMTFLAGDVKSGVEVFGRSVR